MKPELPKRLIVTGGASGIGYAFSEHFAQLGHRVVIADLRCAEEAAALSLSVNSWHHWPAHR